MRSMALVPWNVTVSPELVERAASALQKQVRTHFAPHWSDCDAEVTAFQRWDDVPGDHWRIVLVTDTGVGGRGVHDVTGPGAAVIGQPYALVAVRTGSDDWTRYASHE